MRENVDVDMIKISASLTPLCGSMNIEYRQEGEVLKGANQSSIISPFHLY